MKLRATLVLAALAVCISVSNAGAFGVGHADLSAEQARMKAVKLLRIADPKSSLSIVTAAPPSPAAATHAFGRWLHDRYGNIHGYWTCPLGQTYGRQIRCLAEVHVGTTWHLTSATATPSGTRITFPQNYDRSWVRHWTPYSRHYLTRGDKFKVPGLVSVNGPAFDWAWLALGVRSYWKHHRTFHLDGYDGQGKGLMKFFDFACSVRRNMVSCHNELGDAMHYIVTG